MGCVFHLVRAGDFIQEPRLARAVFCGFTGEVVKALFGQGCATGNGNHAWTRENEHRHTHCGDGSTCCHLGGSGSVSSPASSSGSTQVSSSHVDEDTTQTILICLGIALVIAVGVCFALRAQLKSVAVARNATAYELRDQFRVTASNDVFTGRYVTKTPKPKNDDDSIGGSGFDVGGFGGSSGGKF